MKFAEHQFQAAAYAYIRAALPDAVVWSTDHAGKRTSIQGARLKQRGIVPGIPDMFVLCEGLLVALELKSPGGKETDNQIAFGNAIGAAGGFYHIARSIGEIEIICHQMGWHIRATTMTAQERDARLAARDTAPAKKSKPRVAKPSPSRVRRVQEIMGRYLPPEPLFTGVKK